MRTLAHHQVRGRRERPTVLLDMRMIQDVPHGIGRYAQALLRYLPVVAPDLVPVGLTRGGTRGPNTARAWARTNSALAQLELPAQMLIRRPALYHATCFSAPRLSLCPLVITLHDAIHLSIPAESSRLVRAYYRYVVRPLLLRPTTTAVTVSEYSRGEIARHLDVDSSRLTVIHNGIDDRFRPPSVDDIARVRARYGLPARFALYVGNFRPHKNVDTLLTAVRGCGGRVPLVVAGEDAVSKLDLRSGDPVQSVGSVPDEDLPALYGACTVFVFPSRCEGAGLPPLEAMACGAPVLSARAASLPEMLGEAPLYFDPDDPDELRDVLASTFDDRDRLESLRRCSLRWATGRTWLEMARRHAEVYRSALRRSKEIS